LLNLSIGTALASGDYLVWGDVSDTSQSPGGSDLRISITNFFATVPAPVIVTSASANALAVGRLGATTPAFQVDASTATQVAGLKVTGAGTAGTVAVVVTDSGSDASLSINAKGIGTIAIGSVSTGAVTITPATTVTGLLTAIGGVSGNLTGNVTGNVSGTAPAGSLTGTTLASNVVTSSLTTVGTIGTGVWQGTQIADTYIATISTSGKVSNSATTAVSTNTASAIVTRDGSGNFAAGTITANLTGNASGSSGSTTGNAATATALQTARTINTVSFDGTANITVTAAAGTLSGNTLASGVTASSLTSVGTLAGLTVTATITGAVSGNAGTATALASARTINGVSFDGTANITVTADANTLSGTTLKSTVVTSSLTTVGALNAGSITSGFGAIDIGADALTAGAASFTTLGLTDTLTQKSSGADNNILIRNNSDSNTYNLISLNGVASNGHLGLMGGATGNPSLYIDVPTGGAFNFRVAVGNVASISTAGDLVAASANFGAGAGALTAGAISGTTGTFSGTVGIGVAASASVGLYLFGATALTGSGTSQNAIKSDLTFPAAATVSIDAGFFRVRTTASAYTVSVASGIYIDEAIKGATSTITTLYGLKIEDQTVGGTNYAIYTGAGLVRFGGAATFASTVAVTGAVNFGNKLTIGTNGATGDTVFQLQSSDGATSRNGISMQTAYYSASFIQTQNSYPLILGVNAGAGTGGSANHLQIAVGGAVTIASLAGTGSRTVVADANGVLSAP